MQIISTAAALKATIAFVKPFWKLWYMVGLLEYSYSRISNLLNSVFILNSFRFFSFFSFLWDNFNILFALSINYVKIEALDSVNAHFPVSFLNISMCTARWWTIVILADIYEKCITFLCYLDYVRIASYCIPLTLDLYVLVVMNVYAVTTVWKQMTAWHKVKLPWNLMLEIFIWTFFIYIFLFLVAVIHIPVWIQIRQ